MNRAAIVIGVDRTAALTLPKLDAAASGAREVAGWLEGEGFDVHLFVDDQQPVKVAAICDAITALVKQRTLQQLVVYFAGHGFLRNFSDETWMLSEAPGDANEAISVSESVELSRECRIPSVVFIADTCRSAPQSLQLQRVRGSLIFPNDDMVGDATGKVDRYLATRPGESAQEMVVDGAGHEGLFTHCLLHAFREADPDMVQWIQSEGRSYCVLSNPKLRDCLIKTMPTEIRQHGLVARQEPVPIVESGEDVYIARATPAPPFRSFAAPLRGAPGIADVARARLAVATGETLEIPGFAPEALDEAAATTGFDAAELLVSSAPVAEPVHFETQVGFTILGTRLAEVDGLGMEAELLRGRSDDEPDRVRLYPGQPGVVGQRHVASVVFRFADGSGTVLAALKPYVGTVATEQGRVVNVSYVPSANSDRWQMYQQERARLEKLRAVVAAAARHGVFHVDPAKAEQTADQIRNLKPIDPTLGLYAAYAYAEVGRSELVESVRRYMADDLGAGLFDVALLAGKLSEAWVRDSAVPFCPMLTQGWSLLRARRVSLPRPVERASDSLLPSLWTTFDSAGMDLIFQGIQDGVIR